MEKTISIPAKTWANAGMWDEELGQRTPPTVATILRDKIRSLDFEERNKVMHNLQKAYETDTFFELAVAQDIIQMREFNTLNRVADPVETALYHNACASILKYVLNQESTEQ